jgi:hypothetical protein
MRELHRREAQRVLSLPPKERYMHFLKLVSDSEKVWGLRDKFGWIMGELHDDGSAENRVYFPCWPRSEYAQLCTELYGGHPESMDLYAFMEEFCEGLKEENAVVGVFPTTRNDPICIASEYLVEGLDAYIGEWYE